MNKRRSIYTYISRIAVSIVLLMTAGNAFAQRDKTVNEADTMPLLKGMQLSVDIAGPIIMRRRLAASHGA